MYSRQCRLRHAVVVSGVFALTIVSAASAGGGYALRSGSVVSAGDTVSNNCFTLASTVGEPVAGIASSGSITVTSGFQATVAAHEQIIIADRIFQNGFDSQQGTCTP
ncbi:MAG: hypothetical protein WAS23_11245 [Dokdonella sp.]|nr:hypothetical protein [Dokdonella sp.]HOX70468.1 hypothetical protein [Dokdonella sp.]